jgi:hypothetical protein
LKKEEIQIKASQCKTIKELEERFGGVYNAALRLGIIDEICFHMKRSQSISSQEQILFNQIKNKYPNTIRLIDRKVKIYGKQHIVGLDIDVYIPELKKGIEFDGTYWHSVSGLKRSREHWPIEDLQNYHQIKDVYFLSKGIEILHIKEKDWIKNSEDCLEKCLNFLKTP